MFIINLHAIFRTSRIVMFITFLSTNFYMSVSSGLFFAIFKPKCSENFRTTAMLLFWIPQNNYFNKSRIFFCYNFSCIIQNPPVSGGLRSNHMKSRLNLYYWLEEAGNSLGSFQWRSYRVFSWFGGYRHTYSTHDCTCLLTFLEKENSVYTACRGWYESVYGCRDPW